MSTPPLSESGASALPKLITAVHPMSFACSWTLASVAWCRLCSCTHITPIASRFFLIWKTLRSSISPSSPPTPRTFCVIMQRFGMPGCGCTRSPSSSTRRLASLS